MKLRETKGLLAILEQQGFKQEICSVIKNDKGRCQLSEKNDIKTD